MDWLNYRSDPQAQTYPAPAAELAGEGEPPSTRTRRWPWLAAPGWQALIALAGYAIVWLTSVARPLAWHPGRSQLLIASQDPAFYVWSLRWWPHALWHGLDPLYTHLIAAPAGHSLAWVTTVPPLALLAAPLTVTAGPVVAFNLLTALALPLSAWAAFVACRRLTGRFWPALAGGAVYGFSAFELSHVEAGQLNMCYALLPPLLAYLVLVWWDGSIGRLTFVLLAGLLLAVQFYLFLETFADLTAVLVLSLLLGLALARRSVRARLLRLSGLLGLSYLVALALATPYLADALSSAPPRPPRMSSMDVASLVLPRAGRSLGIGWLGQAEADPSKVSVACSVGIPLLIVVIALTATLWRSRLVWFLDAVLVLLVFGAFGPVLYLGGRPEAVVPWHGLFTLPFVRNAYPARLMLFAFLAFAVATALVLAVAAERWPRWSVAGRCLLGVAVVAFAVLNASGPLRLDSRTAVPAFISSGQYRHELSRGEIVLVVSKVGNAGMLWQAESGFSFRLAGGYINEGLNHRSDLPLQAARLQWATPGLVVQFEELIRTDHIGAVLVDAAHQPAWAGIFGILGLPGHQAGGVVVYPTHGCRTCRGVTRAEIETATFP